MFILVDDIIEKVFYKVVGFCVCGLWVVCVDILECLVDLICLLIVWKLFDVDVFFFEGVIEIGGGFIVIVVMIFLFGCVGEDFLVILKFFGYCLEIKEV